MICFRRVGHLVEPPLLRYYSMCAVPSLSSVVLCTRVAWVFVDVGL